jgi:CRISPR-associated protein Cas5t
MLLSLVGEHFRKRHEGVRLAFAYKQMPRIATTIRKLSRYKYGIPSKQSALGNAPDYIETLCNIEFLCWVDSAQEINDENGEAKSANLEQRLLTALQNPQEITRRGVVCLGLSDDAVNDVSLCEIIKGNWHRLLPSDKGSLELPVWADHVKGFNTRFQRYELEKTATGTINSPDSDGWLWTEIIDPRK